MRSVLELDDRLHELGRRRSIVEKKIDMRLATLAEFTLAKEESRLRIARALEQQSKEAKQRNLQILREISSAMNDSPSGLQSDSAKKLKEAKTKYVHAVEEILPHWKQQQLEAHHETLRKLQFEKELAQERRLRLTMNRQEEEKLQIAVEQERRELMLMLALEQRDKISAAAQAAMLKAQGRAVDTAIAEQVDSLREDAGRLVRQDVGIQDSALATIKSTLAFAELPRSHVPDLRVVQREVSLLPPAPLEDVSPARPRSPTPPSPVVARAPAEVPVPAVAAPAEEESLTAVAPLAVTLKLPAVAESAPLVPVEIPAASESLPATLETIKQEQSPEAPHAKQEQPTPAPIIPQALAEPTRASPDTTKEAINALAAAKLSNMSLTSALPVLESIFLAIESIKGHGHQSGARIAYQSASRVLPGAADIWSLAETTKSHAIINGDDYSAELLCGAVLYLTRLHGALILPSEAFNGMGTLEKLKTVHKKLGGGRAEYWTGLTAHLQALVVADKVQHEEISKIFTSALTDSVTDPAEKSRKERKVQNYLQLAILPEDEQEKRSPTKSSGGPKLSTSIDDLLPKSNAAALQKSVPVISKSTSSLPKSVLASSKLMKLEDDELYEEEELPARAASSKSLATAAVDRAKHHGDGRGDDEFDF